MESVISVVCAMAGLIFGLMFLWDFSGMVCDCGAGRRRWIRAGIKLILALLLLHFHFEIDILG